MPKPAIENLLNDIKDSSLYRAPELQYLSLADIEGVVNVYILNVFVTQEQKNWPEWVLEVIKVIGEARYAWQEEINKMINGEG